MNSELINRLALEAGEYADAVWTPPVRSAEKWCNTKRMPGISRSGINTRLTWIFKS